MSLPREIEDFKNQIQWAIDDLKKFPSSSRLKKFKGKTVEQIWEELLKGTMVLDNEKEKDSLKKLKEIKEYKRIIARGIRTPEQIVAEYPKEKKSNY